MEQERVDRFADVTGDHNYIHVDVERAKQSPFGGTIAHGYLTLALAAPITMQLLNVTDAKVGLNYGLDKVRFPSPLPVGAKWRGGAQIASVDQVPGGLQDQAAWPRLRLRVRETGHGAECLVSDALAPMFSLHPDHHGRFLELNPSATSLTCRPPRSPRLTRSRAACRSSWWPRWRSRAPRNRRMVAESPGPDAAAEHRMSAQPRSIWSGSSPSTSTPTPSATRVRSPRTRSRSTSWRRRRRYFGGSPPQPSA